MRINPKDVRRMTHATATVREWTHTGQQAYLAQQAMPDLSASVYNYAEYHADRSGQSAGVWDLSQRAQITFSWAAETRMMWPNPQGVGSTTIIRLQLADGALVDVTATGGGLSAAGAAYAKSGQATVNLATYTAAQRRSVRLVVTITGMTAAAPIPGQDRHDASVTITGAVAT